MTNDDATEAARPDAPAPLPWETFEGNEGWLIFGPNNELVAYCDYGTDEDNSYSEKATAAFIVRACNAHGDLASVLGEVLACGPNAGHNRALLDRCRAALAKARG